MEFQGFPKLHRYFNSTVTYTTFWPLLPVSADIFGLRLNELVIALATLKSTISPLASFIASSSLQHCHKIADFSNNYHYILLNYILALLRQCL